VFLEDWLFVANEAHMTCTSFRRAIIQNHEGFLSQIIVHAADKVEYAHALSYFSVNLVIYANALQNSYAIFVQRDASWIVGYTLLFVEADIVNSQKTQLRRKHCSGRATSADNDIGSLHVQSRRRYIDPQAQVVGKTIIELKFEIKEDVGKGMQLDRRLHNDEQANTKGYHHLVFGTTELMKWQRIAAVALPLVRCSGAGYSSADEFMLALWEKGFPASSEEFKVVEIKGTAQTVHTTSQCTPPNKHLRYTISASTYSKFD
jgi:hypothetical protein